MIGRLCRAQQLSPIGKRLQALLGLAGNDILDLTLLLDNGDALGLALGIGGDGDLETTVLLGGVGEAEAVVVALVADVGVGVALGVALGSNDSTVVAKDGASPALRSSNTKQAGEGAGRAVKGQANEAGGGVDTVPE